jgi:GNAT superfamily N-acetyltransferase
MPHADRPVIAEEAKSIRVVRILPVEPTAAGWQMLRRFYAEIYTIAIADPNERESLANMQAYIAQRASGRFGLNNYHVLLAVIDGAPVGGIVADYLAEPNAGVIELLAVAPAMRRQGLGAQLHQAAIGLLKDDALRAHGRQLDYVVAEIRNPGPNISSPGRAAMWAGWGYRLMDFHYIQPSLSPMSDPVHTLSLISKSMAAASPETIDAKVVKVLLRNYMIWAMRIANPENNAQYRGMCVELDKHGSVGLLGL